MKTCGKCGETKDVSEFNKNKRSKDGLRPECKACQRDVYQANREKHNERCRAYYQENKEDLAEKKRANQQAKRGEIAKRKSAHYQANKERILEGKRAHYQANREKHNERCRDYYQANKGEILEQQRAYYQKNKEKVIERKVAYKKKRYDEDPAFAMVERLRRRLHHALNGQAKPSSTMELLGCSREDLMAHLESQFAEGMTWKNRGQWHIDHIRPIASFEDPADPRCWHWSNLQPLWAEDNIRKGDRY